MGATHRTAIALLLATMVVWAVVMGWVLENTRPGGPSLIAVFPPGTSEVSVMQAVAGAGGRLVRTTWWPWAYVVHADHATFAARVRDAGALWVLPGGPFRLTMLGGCGFYTFDWRRSLGS